jgi:hypothetical protein
MISEKFRKLYVPYEFIVWQVLYFVFGGKENVMYVLELTRFRKTEVCVLISFFVEWRDDYVRDGSVSEHT